MDNPQADNRQPELTYLQRLALASGSINAIAATMAYLFDQPRFDPIRENYVREVENITTELEDAGERLILFGEAYEDEDDAT